MSWVFRHLEGKTIEWDQKRNEAKLTNDESKTVQVYCPDMICRRVKFSEFQNSFPRIVGSSGTGLDLKRMWCTHFQDQNISTSLEQHPQVRLWAKSLDPEQEVLMSSQLVSLITGLSDLIIMAKNYKDLKKDLRLSIDERWNQWALNNLEYFSKDNLYEEYLQLKVKPLRNLTEMRLNLFSLDFDVTMGELDQVFPKVDKIGLSLQLKLSKSWLRWLKREWLVVNQKPSPQLREDFVKDVAKFLKIQLDQMQKYFPTPLFGEGLEELLARELIGQVEVYQGPFFNQSDDKVLSVPVRFHYGMFALSYMRYKALLKSKSQALDL
jgi:hypothetical protein